MTNFHSDVDISHEFIETELKSLIVVKLKDICKRLNYHGYSSLRKKDLIQFIINKGKISTVSKPEEKKECDNNLLNTLSLNIFNSSMFKSLIQTHDIIVHNEPEIHLPSKTVIPQNYTPLRNINLQYIPTDMIIIMINFDIDVIKILSYTNQNWEYIFLSISQNKNYKKYLTYDNSEFYPSNLIKKHKDYINAIINFKSIYHWKITVHVVEGTRRTETLDVKSNHEFVSGLEAGRCAYPIMNMDAYYNTIYKFNPQINDFVETPAYGNLFILKNQIASYVHIIIKDIPERLIRLTKQFPNKFICALRVARTKYDLYVADTDQFVVGLLEMGKVRRAKFYYYVYKDGKKIEV